MTLFLLWMHTLFAHQGMVIDVKRPLHMNSSSPLPEKQIILDLGKKHGLTKGSKLEVYRPMIIINKLTENSEDVLNMKVGMLEVIEVSEYVSMARTVVADQLVFLGDKVGPQNELSFSTEAFLFY